MRIGTSSDSSPLGRALELGVACALGEAVPELETIKEGRVWRWEDVAFKRYSRGERGLRLRPSPAHREALAASRVAPVPTPEVFFVVDGDSGASLLGTKWVAGQGLGAVASEPRALAALAPFIARQHGHGIFHGDPHPGNQLWDGERWWLIDLDGLRGPIRCLRPKALAARHWGRLWLNLQLGQHGPDPWFPGALAEYAEIRGLDPKRWIRTVEEEVLRQGRERGVTPEAEAR